MINSGKLTNASSSDTPGTLLAFGISLHQYSHTRWLKMNFKIVARTKCFRNLRS